MVADYSYQVGGSVPAEHPSYVKRQADDDLYEGIKAGEFCSVLNSRQMGKSSLRVQTMKRLKAEGFVCTLIQMTAIGSSDITEEKWYNSLIDRIAYGLGLSKLFNLKNWLSENDHLLNASRFTKFIDITLPEYLDNDQRIVIFIEEIDEIISLKYQVNTDELFRSIRACSNNDDERLTFVMLGVATPSDLIADKHGTPFNIGRAIELTGFQLDEAKHLAKGLAKFSNPEGILEKILNLTGGQPFLTQKVCQLVSKQARGFSPSLVDELVKKKIIDNWEGNDEPEHLRTIRDRILDSKHRVKLLKLYQQILKQREIDNTDESEHLELRLTGLVVKQLGKLKVYNPIYEAVFNREWVQQELEKLLPKSPANRVVDNPPRSYYKEMLFEHLRHCAQKESPPELLDRFRRLFVEGRGYPNPEIAAALDRIIGDRSYAHSYEFNYIINRCCHILINNLHKKYEQAMILGLVDLFKHLPSASVEPLQRLVYEFTRSQEYLELQRRVPENQREENKKEEQPLRNLIERYPYLYTYRLLRENSSLEDREEILRRQAKQKRQFEKDLSGYLKYIAQQKLRMTEDLIIQPQKNPTMLSDEELLYALLEFGGNTHKDLAEQFLKRNQRVRSYGIFKDNLYEYLVATVDYKYGKHSFNMRLKQHLGNTFPEKRNKKVNELLRLQTCSELLNLLVVESAQQPMHFIFMDLVNNLGEMKTIALLLKLLLISRQIQPELEERFAILFEHHESKAIGDIIWLVNSLENLNVALSVNFGNVNLSFLKDLR